MPVFRSRDLSWPIRGQYSGHVICLSQSEASITWEGAESASCGLLGKTPSCPLPQRSRSLWAPAFRLCSRWGCVSGWCPGKLSSHVISLDQSEASIQVTWSVSTNQRPVLPAAFLEAISKSHRLLSSETGLKLIEAFLKMRIKNYFTFKVFWMYTWNSLSSLSRRDNCFPALILRILLLTLFFTECILMWCWSKSNWDLKLKMKWKGNDFVAQGFKWT